MLDDGNKLMKLCSAVAVIAGVLILGALLIVDALGFQSLLSVKTWPRLIFIGRLHPVFLHIPIGVFVYIGCCELFALLSRGRRQIDVLPALLLGGVTAIFTSVLGYILAVAGDYGVSELLEEHKRDGFIFTFLALATLFVGANSFKKGSEKMWRTTYRALLVFTLLTLVSVGHHGGEISHGDLFREVLVKDRGKVDPKKANGISYEVMVRPILAEKCEACHGEKKQKGGLRVDSLKAMQEGGDQGASIVAGDLEKSLLISCLHLPLDDDLRMPPEGKPQLTDEEIAILEQWIVEGASLKESFPE